jgi:hypothetical protein
VSTHCLQLSDIFPIDGNEAYTLGAPSLVIDRAQMLGSAEPRRERAMAFKCIRRESALRLAGLPLWSVAIGPDLAKGEARGHARGIFAVGDMATGVLAAGGLARGVVAFGGLAIGLASFGGLGLGLIVALGGGAAGAVAVGGGAAGLYAMGGGAVGTYVLSPTQCDADALDFFRRAFEWWPQLDIVAQNCFS